MRKRDGLGVWASRQPGRGTCSRRTTASVMAVTSTRSRTALASSSNAVFPREDPSSSPEPPTISPNSSRPDDLISVDIGPSDLLCSSSPKPSSPILVSVVAELVPVRPSSLVPLVPLVPLASLVRILPLLIAGSQVSPRVPASPPPRTVGRFATTSLGVVVAGTAACCPYPSRPSRPSRPSLARCSAASRLDISMSPFDSQKGTNLLESRAFSKPIFTSQNEGHRKGTIVMLHSRVLYAF